MLRGRPDFIRLAAIAAAGACCLLGAACGSSSTPHPTGAYSGGTPNAVSTSDPLASLSAAKIEDEAGNNFMAASSLTWSGTVNVQGTVTMSSVRFKRGGGYAGTARFSLNEGKEYRGSYKFIDFTPGNVYLSPDATYWGGTSGTLPPTKNFSLVKGKYLQFSPNDPLVEDSGVAAICDLTQFLVPLGDFGTVTKGEVTTLGGVRVVPIKDTSDMLNTTDYVTDTSEPQVVELTWHSLKEAYDGKFTFSVDASVTMAAPPPSQVLAAAKFGL